MKMKFLGLGISLIYCSSNIIIGTVELIFKSNKHN